jgi:hypothetical protein
MSGMSLSFIPCLRHTATASHGLTQQKYTQDQGEGYQVEWVPHARWVVSGRFYTASGVSAGMDMACAFIDQVAGEAAGMEARSFAEYTCVLSPLVPVAERLAGDTGCKASRLPDR